jgi:hypothetical protein
MSESTIPPIYNLRRPGDLRKQQARLRKAIAKSVHHDRRTKAALQAFRLSAVAPSESDIERTQHGSHEQYNQALNNLKSILPAYQATNVLRRMPNPSQFNALFPGFKKDVAEKVNLNEKYFTSHWKKYSNPLV